jgi:hypothetical protein
MNTTGGCKRIGLGRAAAKRPGVHQRIALAGTRRLGGLGRSGLAVPLTLAVAVGLSLVPDDASAAAMRSAASGLGALALLAMLLFLREWPVALTGSVCAAGMVVAAAVWVMRGRWGTQWLALAGGRSATAATPPTLIRSDSRFALPSSTDRDQVLEAARQCFVALQAAWDASDIDAMRAHTTAEMLRELIDELPLRGPGGNSTDVISLDVALLGFEELGSRYLASVEFSGLIREFAGQGEAPFKELWMLTCPKDEASDWRLARQQALF